MIRSTLRKLARRIVGGAPTIPSAPPTGRLRPTRGQHAPPFEEVESGPEVEVEAALVQRWFAEEGRRPVLVDIREEHEIFSGFATGALLIPMNQIPHRLAELPRDRDLVIYCAAGARSYGVAHYLREQGFPTAWSLAEGLGAWLETGAPWQQAPTNSPLRILRPARLLPAAAAARGIPSSGAAGTIQESRKEEGGWVFSLLCPQPEGPALRVEGLTVDELEGIGASGPRALR